MEHSSKTEKWIFITSLIAMCVSLFLFIDGRWSNYFLGESGRESGIQIGTLALAQHDVRYKRDRNYDWESSRQEQSVYAGDAIFCGTGSQAEITIAESGTKETSAPAGGKIEINENSLVRFTSHEGLALADLVMGRFQIAVNGTFQVSIAGVPTRLSGRDSIVQIQLSDEGRPRLKLIKGEVDVTTLPIQARVSETAADSSRVSTLKVGDDFEVASDPNLNRASIFVPPEPIADVQPEIHFWRLDDLYEVKANELLPRTQPEISTVPLHHLVRWFDARRGSYLVQLSASEDFTSPETLRSDSHSVEITHARIGTTYWRVARDEIDSTTRAYQWSNPARFDVIGQPTAGAPLLDSQFERLWLIKDPVQMTARWSPLEDVPEYIVETSNQSNFSTIQVYKQKDLSFTRPGAAEETLFVRVRGLTAGGELTHYGPSMRFEVRTPPTLPAPVFAARSLTLAVKPGEETYLAWKSVRGATGYQLHASPRLPENFNARPQSNQLRVDEWPVGDYDVSLNAIDVWNRPGNSGRVKLKLISKLSLQLADESSSRAPASVPASEIAQTSPVGPSEETRVAMPQESDDDLPNFLEVGSVSVEGSSAGMFSSEQLTYGTPAPLFAMMTVRGTKWWKELGVEGSLKTKTFSYNSAASNVTPLQGEARAHWRALLPTKLVSFIKTLQASVFGGVEVYRNASGANLYSPGYNLAKVGVTLRFPLNRYWNTGGEVDYGLAPDLSRKYEASGDLMYRFVEQWSLGLGYRLYYFQSGSNATSPFITPYRETYGEGFSTLKFSY